MVDFQHISLLEVESTVRALPPLFLQQLFIFHERMLFEPFGPVQEISIIRACLPFHFHPVFLMRFHMFSDIDERRVSLFVLDVRSEDGSCVKSSEVFSAHPFFGFPWVSCLSPSSELLKGSLFA